jgi:hypothetical protein
MKKTVKTASLFFLFFFLLTPEIFSAEIKPFGNLFYRPQGRSEFKKIDKSFELNGETLLTVPPELKMPLASDSGFLIGSCSVVLFPGSVLKLNDKTFFPLQGRIKLSSSHAQEILIKGLKFSCGYLEGDLLVEVTPEQTAWLLLLKKGQVWLKDFARKVVNFEPSTEVEIPRFGPTRVRQRPSARWGLSPENAVIPDVEAVFSSGKSVEEKNASETKGLASETEELTSDAEKKVASETEELTIQDELSETDLIDEHL